MCWPVNAGPRRSLLFLYSVHGGNLCNTPLSNCSVRGSGQSEGSEVGKPCGGGGRATRKCCKQRLLTGAVVHVTMNLLGFLAVWDFR